jgi:hypothetical protein
MPLGKLRGRPPNRHDEIGRLPAVEHRSQVRHRLVFRGFEEPVRLKRELDEVDGHRHVVREAHAQGVCNDPEGELRLIERLDQDNLLRSAGGVRANRRQQCHEHCQPASAKKLRPRRHAHGVLRYGRRSL